MIPNGWQIAFALSLDCLARYIAEGQEPTREMRVHTCFQAVSALLSVVGEESSGDELDRWVKTIEANALVWSRHPGGLPS